MTEPQMHTDPAPRTDPEHPSPEAAGLETASPETPLAEGASPEGAPERRSFADYLTDPATRRIEWLAVGLIVAFGAFALLMTRGDLLAQAVPVAIQSGPSEPADPVAPGRDLPTQPYRFLDLDIHPDRVYNHYFSGAFFTDAARGADRSSAQSAYDDFRTQLEIYRRRAGEDDNFAIRVYDSRTWRTLEVFSLREERERFEQSGSADWERIDAFRRGASNGLITKWVARGIPRDAVATRWGRANQIAEAREREAHTIEYEIRYARQLGLSLLTTEIGTVETFNQDWLVSPANARGRYQMMPDILDLFALRAFTLPAAAGNVQVREELHPLLSLQSSFLLVRGYSNAVGQEIPGVSAYHTGPGNIMHLYQTFLRAKANDPGVRDATVTEAYMWGVTDGFDRVRQQSSFGPHSRGYVLSAYGALRAVDDKRIDPSHTLLTERVQLREGQTIALSDLLTLLEPHGARLEWGSDIDHANLYERFRALNGHIALPRSGSEETVSVPAAGNVRLAAASGRFPVRFFLPYGATELLERIRPGLLDPARTFRFDDNTFADPAVTGEKTQADYEYDELIRSISGFGFTSQNQNRLERLYRQFVQLAQANPNSEYRQAQLRIITIHRRVWHTVRFRDLAGTVQNVLEASRAPIRAMEPAAPAS
jgi:hypothetical protein